MDYWLKAKTIFLILFSFFVVFFNPKTTLAQSSTTSQGWFCAKTTHCAGANYQQGTCTLNHVHRVRLEVDPENKLFPNNDETYLVECLSQPNNGALDFKCTTGDSNLDIQAFGVDYYTWLKNNWGYSLEKDSNYGIFKVDNNQTVKIGVKEYKTGPSSKLILKENNEQVSVIEWQSFVPEGKSHKFYFFQKKPPQSTESTTIEPGTGGQQQATSSDFEFKVVNEETDCMIIHWDPAGRVFDALSLEPVPGASVFLTKDDGRGNFVKASELGIINPQLTNSQGGFSFYVSDGDYKLSINNLGSLGYERMASNIDEINSKYDRIYYHLVSKIKRTFVYPAQTGEVIKQRGRMEYRDIPLIPSDGQGKSYPLVVISAFYSVSKTSGKVILEGNVSHPFTQIIVYGVNNVTLTTDSANDNREIIYQGITDNLGNYKVVFSQEKDGKMYDSFDVDYKKTNLSTIAKKNSFLSKIISWLPIKKAVFAQAKATNKVSLRLNPIPTYLEGVARDSSGRVLANSQVKIYIKGMNVPYSVVNTDENGYFKVPSTRLPSFPYEIKYQDSTGKVVTVSTSKFIADNRNLISSKKINLYSLKDNTGKAVKITPQGGNLSISPKKNLPQFTNKTESNQTIPTQAKESPRSTVSSGVVLTIATIFFLLIIVGVIVYFYWRQKQSSSMVA